MPSGKVGISIVNGALLSPLFEFKIRLGSNLDVFVSNGSFSSYAEIPNSDYFLDVKIPVCKTYMLHTAWI